MLVTCVDSEDVNELVPAIWIYDETIFFLLSLCLMNGEDVDELAGSYHMNFMI